jgi:hypothetical protein
MSSVMMERTGMGMAGMGPQGQTMTGPAMPATQSWVMVPRCTYKFEKCTGGMKITCTCDDKMSVSTLQNLCTMLQGGMCSCCLTMNGMTVFCCNLTMGLCKCDMTDKGCTVTCTSGDAKCCEMIQACCDCMATMAKAGCTCCLMFNNTPVCCGCC